MRFLINYINRLLTTSIKVLTQAGKLEKVLMKYADCAEKINAFYVMYGQTEATARMSYLPPDNF